MTRLVIFTLAWCGGILLARAGFMSWTWLLLGLPAALVLVIGWWRHLWARRTAAILTALLLGAVRFVLAQPDINANHIAYYNDAVTLICEGVVIAPPEPRNYDTRLQVRVEQITLDDGTLLHARGRVQIYAPPYSGIQYGDRLRFSGTPVTPPVYDTFNYRDYLIRHGVYSLIRNTEPVVLASRQANPVMQGLLWLRDGAYDVLLSILPEPSASLLSGILLGIERGIPDILNDDFMTTGTTHIIAISGFNLTLIAAYVAKLSRTLLRKNGHRLALSLGVLWLYVLFVGAAPAVVRAGVMATLVVISQYASRGIHGPTSLAAAVLLMSVVNPWVLWDAGFQLSFAATAGLIFYAEPWGAALHAWLQQRMDSKKADRWLSWLSDNIIITLAAQFTTLGVIIGTFHRISLISLLTNFLILPVQNYIMILGGVALGAGVVNAALGRIIALPVWGLLSYTVACVQWTARIPGASLPLEWATGMVVAIYYGALIVGTLWIRATPKSRQNIIQQVKQIKPAGWFGAAVLVLLLISSAYFMPDGKLHVIGLAVGDGDAILVITPSGKQLLIDGGADGRQTLSQVSYFLPVTDRTLDAVIVTSPDRYRLPGMVNVLQRYGVDYVLVSNGQAESDIGTAWQRMLSQRDAGSVIKADLAFDWDLGDGVILRTLTYSDEPDAPLAILIDYGVTRIFLGGAVTAQGEALLVQQYGDTLKSNALFVPRHGDATAATPALLGAVNPGIVVISTRSNYPPSEYTLARLSGYPLFRTDVHGNIELISDGERVRVQNSQ